MQHDFALYIKLDFIQILIHFPKQRKGNLYYILHIYQLTNPHVSQNNFHWGIPDPHVKSDGFNSRGS